MDDTLLFIPPCCVDKKLPSAIIQAPRRALSFYTHGDVLIDKFFHAIGYMADVNPNRGQKKHFCVMVLAMTVSRTSATGYIINYLHTCFERGWITHLVLSTDKSVEDWIDIHLMEYRDRILYQNHNDVTLQTSHMVIYNEEKAFTLAGPMLDTPNGKLSHYSMVLYPDYSACNDAADWSNPLKNILFPDILRHRQRVAKEKRKVDSIILNRFLQAKLPPYEEDKEQDGPRDYYDFGGFV